MKRLHFLALTCVCLGIAAMLLFRVNTHASAASPSSCGSWNVVPSPNGANGVNYLYGVATVSANDIWAVGLTSGKNNWHTLTEHWNGTGWSIVPSPSIPSATNYLYGVAAVSTNNVWAVGTYFLDGGIQTLIEHWDGTTWGIVPGSHLAEAELRGVTAISATDIWATGYYVHQNPPYDTQALIEHWNGSQWSVVPNPKNLASILYSVNALSTNDIWAVGYYNGPPYEDSQALVEHWNGSQWSVVPNPKNLLVSRLYSITALSTSNVWAVGYSYVHQKLHPLIEHWNGTIWMITPTPSSSSILDGVAAVSITDIWAVGSGGAGTLIEHWNGTTWSIVPSPSPGDYESEFNAVASIPGSNDVWAVGDATYNTPMGAGSIYTLIAYYC